MASSAASNRPTCLENSSVAGRSGPVTTGHSPTSGPRYHLPYVGLEHIDPGDIGLRRFGEASEVTSAKNRFLPGDVLSGKLRPYLDEAVVADKSGICSTDILVVSATSQTLPDFLVLLLHTQAFRDHAMANTNGVNHPRTSWQAVSSFSCLFPPLPEQRTIAHILRTVQAAREARQREVSLERERKAAVMAHLFAHGTRGEPTKQTPMGEIPRSWGVTTIGDIAEFLQYGTSRECTTEPIGVPVLRIPNVIGGKVDTDDLKYLELQGDEADRLRLAVGDILFVRTNGRREYTGRCAVFMGEPEEASFASYLIRARLKPDTLLPQFAQFYATTPRGSSYLAGARVECGRRQVQHQHSDHQQRIGTAALVGRARRNCGGHQRLRRQNRPLERRARCWTSCSACCWRS